MGSVCGSGLAGFDVGGSYSIRFGLGEKKPFLGNLARLTLVRGRAGPILRWKARWRFGFVGSGLDDD